MSAPSPLSVVIVDDDEFVAQSLRTILEARGSVRVAALGTKGAEAAALFNEHHPPTTTTSCARWRSGPAATSSSRKLVVWPKRCIPSWKARSSWDPMSPTA